MTNDTGTDAEAICEFMETRPAPGWHTMPVPLPKWWYLETEIGPGFAEWHPRTLDLNALREIEQKLIGNHHGVELDRAYKTGQGYEFYLWHLTAAQKQEALAHVIREIKT